MRIANFLAVVALCAGGALASLSASPQESVAPQVIAPPQGRGITPPQGQGRGNQPPPPPLVSTGIIVGRVIDAATGKPVAGATVLINGGPTRTAPPPAPARGVPQPPPPPPPRVLTDSEGRFAFRNLTRGNYTVNVTKPGYAGGTYGRTRPDGPSRPLQLDDNEQLADVAIRIFKYAAVTGRITDEAGEPIVGVSVRSYRRVLVSGRRKLRDSSAATTDDRGVYRIFNLTPGEYVVSVPMTTITAPAVAPSGAAASQNYSQTTQGQPGQQGQQGQQGQYITMGPPSAGSGGRQLSGDARFVLQSGTLAASVTADGTGRWRGYATQYYPSGHTVASAEPIVLASGDERMGIDLTMRYVPVVNISGIVIGPGGPAANYVLRLISSETGEMTSEPESGSASTDGSGAFMFLGVPSGQYVIQTVRMPREGLQFMEFTPAAQPGGNFSATPAPRPITAPPDPLLWAQTPVSVGDADIAGVGLTLQEGFTISGRFEFSGSKPRPDPQRLTQIPIVVEPADARDNMPQNGAPSRATPDGKFATTARLPGKYFVRVGGAPSGFIVQSIVVNGVDANETPVDLTQSITNAVITFTDLIGSVSGTVRGITPGADPPAVVLFPADSRAWKDFGVNPQRMKMTRASAAGAFAFGSLISGDYFAIAIKDEYSSEWQDPAFLELLARTAERFTLNLGEKRAIDLEISPAKPPGSGRRPAPLPAPIATTVDAIQEFQEQPSDEHGPSVGPRTQTPQTPQVRDGRPVEAAGSGSISGVIMQDDGSLSPARLARIRVTGGGLNGERAAITDDEGRYTVGWLPTGDYQVSVSKPAYLLMYYGGRRPTLGPGTPVHIDAGQRVTGIDVTLQRGAVIAGAVLDPLGQPAPGVRVQVMMFTRRDGERVLTAAASSGLSTTNDRGEYRFYGLRPGSYVVHALPPPTANQDVRQLSDAEMRAAMAEAARAPTPPSVFETPRTIARAPVGDIPMPQTGGKSVGYSPVFYPGTPRDAEAAEIAVTAGQELNGINIQLLLVPTARMEGRMVAPNGLGAAGANISLTRVTGNGSSIIGSTIPLRRQDEVFQAIGVPAGHYFLYAYLDQQAPRVPATPGTIPAPPAPPTTYWSQQEFDVDGTDILNLVVALMPPLRISGRVVFDGATKPDLNKLNVRLENAGTPPASRGTPAALPDATGAFTLNNVVPGKYRLAAAVTASPAAPGAGAGPALPWSVVSATIGGQDALLMPFQMGADREITDAVITLTNQPAEVSGKLIDGLGKPVPGMTIVLFTTDRTMWAMTSSRVNRTIRASADGEYRFTATLPGEYYLAVLTELDSNDWNDPAFKEQLVPSSIKVSVAKGEKKVQDMRVAK